MTLLAARGVSRTYGSRVALHPVDVDLEPGEVVALVGPNGAGKSTLLAILAGALEPTASLDPEQRGRLGEIARDVRDNGGAVLVATHHWEELEGRADRTLELREGRLT